MRAIGTKKIFKNRNNKLFIFVTIVSLTLIILAFVSPFHKQPNYGDDELGLYVNSESRKFIELALNHLRVNPSHDCECTRDSFIKLERNERLKEYHVYMVKGKKVEFLYNLSFDELFRKMTVPCNLYSMLRRGKHQFVVSYCLYGQNAFYYEKLKDLSLQIHNMYPGWLMRVYYDQSINTDVICEIECNEFANVDFCDVTRLSVRPLDDSLLLNASYVQAAIWRYFALADEFVDLISFRDADSYILQREVDAVNAWLKSNKEVHLMRDHPMHTAAIMGGMWGIKVALDRDLSRRIFLLSIDREIALKYNPNLNNTKGGDQDFLAREVNKLVEDKALVHDSFDCKNHAHTSPWPTQRTGNCFVGSPMKCNETVFDFYECPFLCRPRNHRDWKYC